MKQFQSTLPARGATYAAVIPEMEESYFNPRSPHGERPHGWAHGRKEPGISIHAPRTGSDIIVAQQFSIYFNFNPRSPHGERLTRLTRARWHGPFQSTLPARGATRLTWWSKSRKGFQSTLPARGATATMRRLSRGVPNFNPRSPHGERRDAGTKRGTSRQFQSTLPARGATTRGRRKPSGSRISIHAPRTGSDAASIRFLVDGAVFQSTLPARGATVGCDAEDLAVGFQSTLPARGATLICSTSFFAPSIFQSTLPARGATERPQAGAARQMDFNPRSPHGERRGRLMPCAPS